MSEDQDKQSEPLSFDSDKAQQSDSDKKLDQSDDNRATRSVNRVHSSVKRRKVDPTKDTTVFSGDDSRLKRILNNQNDENLATMSLGDKQEVILLIRGMVERVVMEVGKTYKLGRFELGAAADDEIDLTPYGATDRGVSRVHAEMKIIDGVVHLIDLGSTNGTFVNTKQIAPNTPIPMRKGDELVLGRLAVQILFR